MKHYREDPFSESITVKTVKASPAYLKKRGLQVVSIPKQTYYVLKNPKTAKENFIKRHPLLTAAASLGGGMITVAGLRFGGPYIVGKGFEKLSSALLRRRQMSGGKLLNQNTNLGQRIKDFISRT